MECGKGVHAGGGGRGQFPGQPEQGLAIPTGAPTADGPRLLCPQSAAATGSNVTAGPQARVMGAEQTPTLPPARPALGRAEVEEQLGGGGAATEELDQLGGLRSAADLRTLVSNPAPAPPHHEPLLPQTGVFQTGSLAPPLPCPSQTPIPEPSFPSKSPFLRPLLPTKNSGRSRQGT